MMFGGFLKKAQEQNFSAGFKDQNLTSMQILELQIFIGNKCASGEGKVKGNSFFQDMQMFSKIFMCPNLQLFNK